MLIVGGVYKNNTNNDGGEGGGLDLERDRLKLID